MSSQQDSRSDSTLPVTVLGAGITGLTLGLVLARSGREVAVVDPGLQWGSPEGLTGAPASVQQALQLHHVHTWFGPRASEAYARQAERGIAFVTAFCADMAETDEPVGLHQADMATVTADGHEAFWLRNEAVAMRAAGLQVDFTDNTGLPFSTRPVLLSQDQPVVDLVAYRDSLARQLVASGGELHSSPPAGSERGWVVSTTPWPSFAEPRLRARLAADEWSWLELTGDPAGFGTRSAFDLDDGGRMWVRQGDTLWFGSRGDDGLQQAGRWFPEASIARRWRTTVTRSLDSLPLVGPVGELSRRRLVATGFDCWELTNGTAAALQLAELITTPADRRSADSTVVPWRLTRMPQASALLKAALGNVRRSLQISRVTPFPRR